MMFYAFIVFMLHLAACVPHTHKSKSASKENIADGFIHRDSDHYKDGSHQYEFDHESILGSHDAAEQFDHLAPEESKKRLHILALKMDKNGDSYVTKEELIQWVLRSFQMLTEEEALDQLEDEDSDEDSKITWEEHVAETYGVYDDDLMSNGEKKSSEDYQMIQNDKELFKAADKNGDGILDRSEFSAFSHPEEFEHMHQIVYDQAMRKRDKNGDGFLSFEEFIADNHGAAPVQTTEHYITEKDRFIHDYDLDGDGKLNKQEALLWLIPDNMDMAENEAEHLIESSDTDRDGKLSIDEIIDHHEVFVGSEATDFGEHLHNTHKFTDEL